MNRGDPGMVRDLRVTQERCKLKPVIVAITADQ